jgi:hypothetical protein
VSDVILLCHFLVFSVVLTLSDSFDDAIPFLLCDDKSVPLHIGVGSNHPPPDLPRATHGLRGDFALQPPFKLTVGKHRLVRVALLWEARA